MNVEKITMPKEQAKEEWKKYNELLKKRKEKYLQDMKKAMYHLKEGKELLDIYHVMEKIGVNKKYHPKFAIARADWATVYFHKKDTGQGFFNGTTYNWLEKSKGDVDMPPETFMHWERWTNKEGQRTHIINEDILKTKVPKIPANIHPEGDLKTYYILWEVDEWTVHSSKKHTPVPRKDDPLLLKRITENLFVILGMWDVTDLEQSIIRGL